MEKTWSITIDRFEGLTPAFFENEFPTLGNKGHASDTQNVDMIDPNVLTQGPALADLTNGNQAAAVTTLIKGILQTPMTATLAYAVGGAKLYKFTSAAVTNDATFPHTINKAAVTGEDGEDVCEYQGKLYYSFNHSGNAGDVGVWDDSAFDDDYMSTFPTGAAALAGSVPHPMLTGGDDLLYIANGANVARFNGDTVVFTAAALDLPTGEVIVDMAWTNNRLYLLANRPNNAGTLQLESSIYVWDTTSPSWEYQVKVMGRGGALYVKNGVIYIWFQDVSSTGGYKLGYVNETSIVDLAAFTGSLPSFHQKTEHKNHLIWASSGELWAWGASSVTLPTKLFQYADAGHATAGGITNAFGTPMVASNTGSSYRFAKFSGYDTNCTWESLVFDVSGGLHTSYLDRVTIFTEPLGSGAAVDTTVTTDYGLSSVACEQANSQTTVKHTILRDSIEVQNFRLGLSFVAGSATNPVKVRKIIVDGHFTEQR